MKIQEIKSERLKDKYIKAEHPSGLRIYLYPQEGRRSTYAIIGTKYGSMNNMFRIEGKEKITEVPDGIAHYLEHKLFESEDGDAFSKYSKTGASANAYTSFDMTCYLFSCTENFDKSFEILMDLIQSPYFTPENVQKEQGIIGQEIKMYEDNAGWRVLFNLLCAMYHNHPIKKDIAGTVETIAEITPERLYECYNSFYNLKNMALCIAGNIDPDAILANIDSLIKPNEIVKVESIFPDEPYEVLKSKVEQRFDITVPMFEVGFKEKTRKNRASEKEMAETDILLEILASKYSPLYTRLMDENLINASFGYEYFEGDGYAAVIFSGESKDPDKTLEIIKEEIERLRKEGITKEDFEIAKKAIYGSNIGLFNRPKNIANAMIGMDFAKREIFRSIDAIANVNLEDVEKRFSEQLDTNNCSLSVVLPLESKEK